LHIILFFFLFSSYSEDDDDDDAEEGDGMDGDGEGDGEGGGKKDDGTPVVPPVLATPADGIIQPYQQIPIVVTFAPRAKARKTGWAQNALTKSDLQRDFHVQGVVQCVDTAQKITFTVAGRGVLPQVDLARDIFDFGCVSFYFLMVVVVVVVVVVVSFLRRSLLSPTFSSLPPAPAPSMDVATF